MLFEIKESIDAMCYPFYLARGRRPWSPGYYTAKRWGIENAIDAGSLKPGTVLPEGYGFRLDERVIEYPWVLARLPQDPGAMLDAGSALNYKFLIRKGSCERREAFDLHSCAGKAVLLGARNFICIR